MICRRDTRFEFKYRPLIFRTVLKVPTAHLVLPAFHTPLGDWQLVDSGPVAGAFLPLLQPVPNNHGSAIVPGRFPGKGHGGLRVLRNGWFVWWTGKPEGVCDLDLLCCTGVRFTVAVLSSDTEQVGLVGVQVPHLQEMNVELQFVTKHFFKP